MAERSATFFATPSQAAGVIRLLPSVSRLSLRIKQNARAPRRIVGVSLDQPINRFSSVGGRRAARLGPDEWLIIDASSTLEALVSDITKDLAGCVHALIDLSSASVAFAIHGPDAVNILNAGCPLDLNIESFPAGSATRTVLGKCQIVLFRLKEFEFRVECWLSYREYVHAFLIEAAALNSSAHTLAKEPHQ
jgi:sarcosine oxidase subunit gamma